MGKTSRRKQQQKHFVAVPNDGHSTEVQTRTQVMLDTLQKKLDDDALREDGFCFTNGKFVDSRRPRVSAGMKTRKFERHQRSITDIAIVRIADKSKREEELDVLFTFGLDCVSIWNLSNGKLLAALDVSLVHVQSIHGCAVYSTHCELETILFVYAAYNEPVAHCFDYRKNAIIPVPAKRFGLTSNCCTGHEQAITSMAFSRKGDLLATSSWDSTCMIWQVTRMVPTVDSWQLRDNVIHLTLITILPIHEQGATCLALTDETLVTCGESIVKLWNIADVSLMTQRDANENDTSEKTLPLDNQLVEWQEAISFSANVFAFDESLSGNHEWLQSEKAHTLFASLHSKDEHDNATKIGQGLDCDAIDPDVDELSTRSSSVLNDQEAVDGGDDDTWTRQLLHEEYEAQALTAEESSRLNRQIRSMADDDFDRLFAPPLSLSIQTDRGTRLTSCPNVEKLLLRTFTTRTMDGMCSSHSSTITGCAVALALDLVVTVALDKSIRYWSLKRGVIVETVFEAHDAPITCCALTSPATCDLTVYEMLLATGGSDNLVKVWRRNEMARAECVHSIAGHHDTITSLAFDPSGVFLVSASEDTSTIMWCVRPSRPEAPERPTLVRADSFSIRISWTEPLANGAKILHYVVRTTPISSFIDDKSETPTIPDAQVLAKYTTKTIEKLQPGVQYLLQVAAVNHIGTSAFSAATDSIETLAFVPSRIERPIHYTCRESTRITLSWTAPCPNGAAISSYVLQCRPENAAFVPLREVTVPVADLTVTPAHSSGTSTMVVPQTISVRPSTTAPSSTTPARHSTLSYVVDELWAGEVYQFVVAASNRCGLGEFSRLSDYVKMNCAAPEQPTAPEIINVQKRQLDVQWEKPRGNGSEILQYTLRYRQTIDECLIPNEQTIQLLSRSITGTRYTLTGLEPGSPVQVWLTASNWVNSRMLSSLESPPSKCVATLSDVPDTPTAPSLLDPSAHSMVLAWMPPKGNGLPIDTYKVALYSIETSFGVHMRELRREITLQSHEVHRLRSDADIVSFSLCHLQSDTLYSATLSACNSVGTSGVSVACAPVQTSAPTIPASVPDAPVISNITPVSAVVTWKSPLHDGGAPLRGFLVEYTAQFHRIDARSQGTTESGGAITVSDLELNATFLKPHRRYRFRVSSENRVGRASPSAWSEEFVSPSLVTFTVTRYFAHRPFEEHEAARVIQRRYRAYNKWRSNETRYTVALVQVLRHWHL